MNHLQLAVSLLAVSLIFGSTEIFCQDPEGKVAIQIAFPEKLFKKVNDKATSINYRLTSQSEKNLRKIAREERKLRRIVSGKDTALAEKIFGNARNQYIAFQQRINNGAGASAPIRNRYIPYLDSLHTAFKLLDNADGLFNSNPGTGHSLREALGKLDVLQQSFGQAEDIGQFVQQRSQLLQYQLGMFGLSRELKKMRKQVYYYQAQVEEYRRAISDPSALEAKAMAILQKTDLYRKFFRQHSQLAALFRLPGASAANSNAVFTGLQSRQGLEQLLIHQFGSLPDLGQMTAQMRNYVTAEISDLKNLVNVNNSVDSDLGARAFTPNSQKTRSIKKRLEFGTNIQTVKSNNFFPSTSDIALSMGYKLNDKSTIGVGSAYKMGWGKDIRHITVSHQGIGLRSFLDFRIRGNIWLAGGAEMNYRSQFKSFEVLKNYTPWQKSALIGLSNKYQLGKKLKGNMQLMYDFLYKQQVPRTQALVFRIGYVL